MNSDQLLSGENGSIDIGTQLPDITSSITDMLMPIVLLSLAMTVIFVGLYISSIVRRRRVENAIFDIQKTLHEMNERDKARSTPKPIVTPPPQPRSSDGAIIARDDAV